ncbi:hypothetical protein [Thiohalocapsa halophila]|nr:hypothetical protein [Thiohalocapsa halophila]
MKPRLADVALGVLLAFGLPSRPATYGHPGRALKSIGMIWAPGQGCYPAPMSRLLIQHRRRTQLDSAAETLDPTSEPMTGLPLMGRVSAGHPVEAIEDPDWI